MLSALEAQHLLPCQGCGAPTERVNLDNVPQCDLCRDAVPLVLQEPVPGGRQADTREATTVIRVHPPAPERIGHA